MSLGSVWWGVKGEAVDPRAKAHENVFLSVSEKVRTNVTLDPTLFAQARARQFVLSAMLEEAIRAKLKAEAEQVWLAENAPAFEAYSHEVERHGGVLRRKAAFLMAQFDLQSELLGRLPTRVVAPLRPVSASITGMSRLNPVVVVGGEPFLVVVQELAALPATAPGALDLLFSGF
jgi:post-segregation antitoxin (ccd killing protein)